MKNRRRLSIITTILTTMGPRPVRAQLIRTTTHPRLVTTPHLNTNMAVHTIEASISYLKYIRYLKILFQLQAVQLLRIITTVLIKVCLRRAAIHIPACDGPLRLQERRATAPVHTLAPQNKSKGKI